MSHAPSPASTSGILTSGPVFTFRWICPNPLCHTCPARTARSLNTGLHPKRFDDYFDMGQLSIEVEMEELDAKALTDCGKQCEARQVFKSHDPKAFWMGTGKDEWSYVGNAKCTHCGRFAGRTACLVDLQREGDDKVIEQELSLEQYIE